MSEVESTQELSPLTPPSCKQVLTIALAVILFNLHISITNGIGIFLTLCGGALYAYVEFTEKRKKQLSASTPKP